MNEQLHFLVELQDIDQSIGELQRQKKKIPLEIEKIKNFLDGEKKKIEETKKNLKHSQVEKKNQEIELDTREQAICKHLAELNMVKTNEAYRALLSEIEKDKLEKIRIEDRILELMQEIENSDLEIKQISEKLKAEEQKNEKEIELLREELVKIDKELNEEEEKRKNYLGKISSSLLARYEKIRESKEGLAVVPIETNHCSGCRMLLPPNLVNEIFKDQGIVTCEVCSRILYLPRTFAREDGGNT